MFNDLTAEDGVEFAVFEGEGTLVDVAQDGLDSFLPGGLSPLFGNLYKLS